MSYPSTKKIVERVVKNYRAAGKAMGRAARRDGTQSWMSQDTFDDTADAIQAAYDDGKFDNVTTTQADELMDKYGVTDAYHLLASYFNATGKILNVSA